MAGPCLYTYKGKEYTYSEFRALMADGLARELVEKGDLNLPSVVADKAEFVAKVNEKVNQGIDSNEVPAKKRDKSLLNRLVNGDLSQEAKDAIKAKGLEYEQFSNKVALELADGVIADFKDRFGANEWQDAAVEWAKTKQEGIPMSVNGLVLGRVTADMISKENSTDILSEKLEYADMAADIVDIIDTNNRDFGRYLSAIREMYKMTELGVRASIKKKLSNVNDAHMDEPGFKGGKSKRELVNQAYDELKKLKESMSSEIEKAVNEKMDEILEQLPKEKKSYAKKAVDALDQLEKDILSGKVAFSSVIPPPVAVAVIKAAKLLIKGGMLASEAIEKAIDNYKKENKDSDYDFETAKPRMEEYLKNSGIDDTGKKSDPNAQANVNKAKGSSKGKTKAPLTLEEEQMKVLNRIFPKKRIESAKKRQAVHEKIIEAFNAGALDRPEFEKKFYEKFGLVNPDAALVKAKMDEMSKRIFNAADGGLKEREYTNMLNFIEDQRKSSLMEWATTPFYANILSGYETHLNNAQFNIWTGIAQTALLSAKSPKNAAFIGYKLLSAIPDALTQGKNIIVSGQKFGAEAKAESLAERRADKGFGISHYYKMPGRLLSAGDAIFNTPIKRMKKAELLLKIANNYNDSLPKDQRKSRKEIQADINDIMFGTTERRIQAEEQAKNDIIKLEGPNVDFNDKKIARDLRMRTFEIMETTRPEDKYLQYGIDYNAVTEEAQDFANRSLLQGKPVGSLGGLATLLETSAQMFPVSKFGLTTFINVPLNLANMMIDKSPLGLVRMAAYEARGRRGVFIDKEVAKRHNIQTELTPDQRKEAWIKAATYSTALVGLYALSQQEYTDDEGKTHKILEVTTDGTGDYQKNREIHTSTGGEYKEYTFSIYGHQFSYKYNSILAPLFIPIGALSDYQKYRDKTPESEKDLLSKVAYGTMSYLDFVRNQANLQGFRDLFGDQKGKEVNEDNWSEVMGERLQRTGGKIARGLVVPNFLIQGNKDVKGLMDMAEKKPVEWYDYMIKDVPFVESIMKNRYDHFGRDVKSEFSLPIVAVPDKLNLKAKDPLYEMTLKHKYYPTFVAKKTVFDGEDEIDLTDDQMDEMNKLRGEYVRKKLEDPKKLEGETFESLLSAMPADKYNMVKALKGKTYAEILDQMDDDSFKEEMNKLFKAGELDAKSKVLGLDVPKKIEEQKLKTKFSPEKVDKKILKFALKPFSSGL